MKKTKKTVIAFFLVTALVVVQIMQMNVAAASESPTVVCSSYSELYQAFIQADDGDVIGIDNIIDIQVEGGTFGNTDKHVTIIRMNDGAMIQAGTNNAFTFKNITLDGNGINSYNAMVNVGWNVNFEDVTFQNAKCVFDGCGGAVSLTNGTVKFTGCTFKGNSSVSGGHLLILNDCQVTINGCTFENGFASNGGAINQNSSSSYVTITDSTIQGNTASESGGGIYSKGRMVIENSKVFKNSAPLGEDITCTVLGNVQVQDGDALEQTFADENITVNGWIVSTDENNASIYRKLDYEEIVEPSPGDSGDNGNQGNTDEGNGGQNPSTPSDTDGNGSSDNQSGDSQTNPGNSDSEGTGSDVGGNTSTDNSNNSTTDNSSHDITTDNSDHSNTSTNTSDNSQTSNNSGNTSTTTNTSNNSKTDNSRTESSDNHSSTTYNYYQSDTSKGQNQEQQPVVINNYTQTAKSGQTASQGQQVDNSSSSKEMDASDPSNNIRIDAKGVDVTFEVIDGVYSISINGQSSDARNVVQASAPSNATVQEVTEAPSKDFSVNWYEVIKIALLAALVVNVLWKRKEKPIP